MEIDITREQLRAAALSLCALALAVCGWWWLQQPATPSAAVEVSSSPTTLETRPAEVVVDVVGRVKKPGIVRLPFGSRVVDAIKAAGGVRPGSKPGINLARFLEDGEQIVVGLNADSSASVSGRLNLNQASADQLQDLPGVGPVLAQRIIDYRTENGSFASVSELDEVSGVGPSMMENVADLVTV